MVEFQAVRGPTQHGPAVFHRLETNHKIVLLLLRAIFQGLAILPNGFQSDPLVVLEPFRCKTQTDALVLHGGQDDLLVIPKPFRSLCEQVSVFFDVFQDEILIVPIGHLRLDLLARNGKLRLLLKECFDLLDPLGIGSVVLEELLLQPFRDIFDGLEGLGIGDLDHNGVVSESVRGELER
jgi:hypothetical protein